MTVGGTAINTSSAGSGTHFSGWLGALDTSNSTNIGSQTLAYQNSFINPGWSIIAAAYPKIIECYEGAMEAFYPSTGQCTTMGISTSYGGPTGKIANLLFAYKNDARFKALVISQRASFGGTDTSTTRLLVYAWWQWFCQRV